MNDDQTSFDFSPALPIGTMLGQYLILKVIGSGGFGITYLAQEETTKELVVIKENYPSDVSFRNINSLTIGPAGESKKEAYEWALKRFQDEAQILSSLNHSNIVPVYHAFKALGTAYYVMPHVEGTELHHAAPDSDIITAAWLLPVLEKILSALDYLHAQGLIHRDIKPSNILLRADGEPIIIDFGSARALEGTHSHTQIGTLGFMPIEQFSDKGKRGPWTDLYALGATCYNLITGEAPPASTDRTEEDQYYPLAGRISLAIRFPAHVLKSIDKALLMNRTERWQSAQEWLDALKGTPSSQSGKATQQINYKPDSSQKSSKRKKKNSPIIFILLLAAFLLGVIGININKTDKADTTPPTIKKGGGRTKSSTRTKQQQPALIIEKEADRTESTRLDLEDSEQLDDTLHAAAREGDAEKVRFLIASGADVNKVDEFSIAPLIWAADLGHTECLKLLLEAPGIDVNKANKQGGTPLIHAAANGRTECVRLLLKARGIDVNKANQDGHTPLHAASDKGQAECVRLLIKAPKIEVNKVDKSGAPPLCMAAHNGHAECVKLLLTAPGIKVNKPDDTPLIHAALNGHTECVKLLLAAPGIDVNKANQKGGTPLIAAAFKGHTECVRLLLASPGIDINKEGENNTTALSIAEAAGHTECARLIREASERINTPLYDAAREGDAEKVRFLIASGADVNKVDEFSITPLNWAADLGHTECLKLLLAAPGIDVNKADKQGGTPLIHAAANGRTECVRLLLKARGIDVNKANQDGHTPLHAASGEGQAECVRLLIKAPKIEVNKVDKSGAPPLCMAAHNGHAECVKLLLTAPGIKVNKPDDTPLIHAALNGHTECVKLLLAAPGIDVNKANQKGGTPLIAAAFKGHTKCVRLLLKAPGIDVNKAGLNNTTALSIAEAAGHTECARLIRAAGGRK